MPRSKSPKRRHRDRSSDRRDSERSSRRRHRSRSRSKESRRHDEDRHRHRRRYRSKSASSSDSDREREKSSRKISRKNSGSSNDKSLVASAVAAAAATAALINNPTAAPSPSSVPVSDQSNITSAAAKAVASAKAVAANVSSNPTTEEPLPMLKAHVGPWELVIKNVFDASVDHPATFYEELELEVGGECHRHSIDLGGVIDAKCDYTPEFIASNASDLKLGGLRVLFSTSTAARKCRDLLHGRWFDERRLDASVTGATDNLPPLIVAPKSVPTSSTKVEVVHINKEQSKLDRALAAVQMKLVKEPESAELTANKSGILGLLGRWTEALAAADQAIGMDSSNGWAHYRRSEAALALKDYPGAVRFSIKAKQLEPNSSKFSKLKDKVTKEARLNLDDLDMISLDMEIAAAEDLEQSNKKEELRAASMAGKVIDIDEGRVDLGFQFNPAAHCYICKQRGHTKVDCPMRKCGYCFEMGHKRSDCPKLTEDLEKERQDAKIKKRKEEYATKKQRRKDEWVDHLRGLTGLEGHAPLYEILGLPTGKAATEAEIKSVYKKLALKYHPDKNANAEDPAAIQQKFMEVKAAYELLLEGLASGQSISASASAAFSASSTGGGAGGRNATDLAVKAALGLVNQGTGSSLNARAAELAKQRTESSASNTTPGAKVLSETEG